MKKLVMTVAVLACAASIVSAQTVTSANIVGYNKDVALADTFHIAMYQFNSEDSDPNSIYGASLPVGSKIYAYNVGTSMYDISTYIDDFDENFNPITTWFPNTLDLSDGSWWVAENGGFDEVAVLSGEVELSGFVTNSIVSGLQMTGYPYPVAMTAANDLELPAVIGDKLYVYNVATAMYDISTYIDDFDENFNPIQTWFPNAIDLSVGEGFFYESASATNWVVTRPF